MLRGTRVVIADDSEQFLYYLSTLLGSLGVLCMVAANGKVALELLESHPDTDILLLDIQMPVMDGFEVLSHCKSNPRLRDLSIIVLTGNSHEKLKCLKLGVDDFLAKPFNTNELVMRFTKLVEWRRMSLSATQAKKEFLAIASHELRTPLHQILGLADLLDAENSISERREVVGLLKQSTINLSVVIRDILDYAQFEQGSAIMMAEPFSLRSTLNSALDFLKKQAGNNGIKSELIIAEDVADGLIGPSSYVYKVFSILLDNAAKYSSAGCIRITIQEESLGSRRSRFSCSVSDQGIGIPVEFHGKIFEPFVQVAPSLSRSYNGIGLGLAIAKRIVEMMGGAISVDSTQDMGSSFKFFFYCSLQNTNESCRETGDQDQPAIF